MKVKNFLVVESAVILALIVFRRTKCRPNISVFRRILLNMSPSPANRTEVGKACRSCGKLFTAVARIVPCPKCKSQFHTNCANKQSISANGGFSLCCDSSVIVQQTHDESSKQTSLVNNTPITIDSLQEILRTTNEEQLFTRIKAEMNALTESVSVLQHQVVDIMTTVENHESRRW